MVGISFITPADIGLTLSPIPLMPGQDLQMVLENEYSGPVHVDVFSMDGRFLSGYDFEKAEHHQAFELDELPTGHSFWIRVSQGNMSAARLLFRF